MMDGCFVLKGCSILSGDLIVRQLAKGLKPSFVVFLVSCPNASCACIFTLMPRVSLSIWRSEWALIPLLQQELELYEIHSTFQIYSLGCD
jgi:hypothetical protein